MEYKKNNLLERSLSALIEQKKKIADVGGS